jgi:hypothetical protein
MLQFFEANAAGQKMIDVNKARGTAAGFLRHCPILFDKKPSYSGAFAKKSIPDDVLDNPECVSLRCVNFEENWLFQRPKLLTHSVVSGPKNCQL